jgi:hypothetical protein
MPTYEAPRQVVTRDGTEFVTEWTCPRCGCHQHDTVHPVLWVSAICGECEVVLGDDDLQPDDRNRWSLARDAAAAYGIDHGIEFAWFLNSR